jgi:hypothetical protein
MRIKKKLPVGLKCLFGRIQQNIKYNKMKKHKLIRVHQAIRMYGGVEVQFQHFLTPQQLEMSDHFHVPGALAPRKELTVTIG